MTSSSPLPFASDMPVIDTHVHIYTNDIPFSVDAWSRPDFDFPVEALLQTLDEHGVPLAVIAGASIFGDFNDYVTAALQRHPQLRATIMANPEIDLYTMRRMKDDGVVGVRLLWWGDNQGPDLSSIEYKRLLYRVRDLNWHVEVFSRSDMQLSRVLDALKPTGVRVVIDHFGLAEPELGPNSLGFQSTLRALSEGWAWVKLAAAYLLGDQKNARTADLLRAGGPDRMFWGSDAPFIAARILRNDAHYSYADSYRWFAEAIPRAADRRASLEGSLKFYFE